jgi:hypothetical protein
MSDNLLPPQLNIAITKENMPPVDNSLFEALTTPVTVPNVNADVYIPVKDTLRYQVGMYLYFNNAGVFRVMARYSATILTLRNINVTPGSTIVVGTVFQSTGIPYTLPQTLLSTPDMNGAKLLTGSVQIPVPDHGPDQILAIVNFTTEFANPPTIIGPSIESDVDLGMDLSGIALYARDVRVSGFFIFGTITAGGILDAFTINWMAVGV